MHATWGLGIKCINVDLKKNKKILHKHVKGFVSKCTVLIFLDFFFFFIGLGNTWFAGI